MLKATRSWDPLYGRIDFTDFEFGLIHLSEVQRLRYVRMCNINSLLVTGASEISRFEHTIGVMHLTKTWCKAHKMPESTSREIIAAAVLHDMQTGPFGHSMQYVLEDNELDTAFIHDDLSHGWRSTYHQDMLARASFAGKPFSAQSFLGKSWEAVAKIIRGEGPYGPLIAGTMDLDNIDNVVRLAFHVGVADKSDAGIAEQLARDLIPLNGGISLPSSAIPTVKRWQKVRHDLYRLLLLDWAEFSAKAMLTRAIELATTHEIVGADSWIRTDAEFLEDLERKAIGEAQNVRDLVRRLRYGDLYIPLFLGGTPSIDMYSMLSEIEFKHGFEASLARLSGVKGVLILTHFILDKGKTDRAITLTSESGAQHVIGEDSRQLLCGLFASSQVSESEKASLVKAFKDFLHELGVVEPTSLEDPMGSGTPAQTILI